MIDRFGDAAVVQISVNGMDAFQTDIAQILKQDHGITRVIFKNDGKCGRQKAWTVLSSADDPSLTNLRLEENGAI